MTDTTPQKINLEINGVDNDPFKKGAAAGAGDKKVIFVDLRGGDTGKAMKALAEDFKEIVKTKTGLGVDKFFTALRTLSEKDPESHKRFQKRAKEIMGPQFKSQFPAFKTPGMTLDDFSLTGLQGALSESPFAITRFSDSICVISTGTTPQFDLLDVFNDDLQKIGFKPQQFVPLTPKEKLLLLEAVGVHEGAHCNFPRYNGPPELRSFANERHADIAAISFLKEKGRGDLAQRLKDYRVINALSGDDTHAASAINDDPAIPLKKEDFEAARVFPEHMDKAVAAMVSKQFGKPYDEDGARNLRQSPETIQLYANLLDQSVKEGSFSPNTGNPALDQSITKYIDAFRGAIKRTMVHDPKFDLKSASNTAPTTNAFDVASRNDDVRAKREPRELLRAAREIRTLADASNDPKLKTAMELMRDFQVAANPDTDIKPALSAEPQTVKLSQPNPDVMQQMQRPSFSPPAMSA